MLHIIGFKQNQKKEKQGLLLILNFMDDQHYFIRGNIEIPVKEDKKIFVLGCLGLS